MTNYYVYIHILDNKIFYVGYGQNRRYNNVWARKRRYKEYVNGREYDVICKILHNNLTKECAEAWEIYYQLYYRQIGEPVIGLIGNKTDKEFHDLQSSKLKGRKRNPEANRKMVETRRNNGKPWHSEETKEKIRNLHWHHSEETKEKIRQLKLGKKNPKISGQLNGMSKTNRERRLKND